MPHGLPFDSAVGQPHRGTETVAGGNPEFHLYITYPIYKG
jgi:hypothetical protein